MSYKTKGLTKPKGSNKIVLQNQRAKSMSYKTKGLKQNSLSQCLTKPKSSNKIV